MNEPAATQETITFFRRLAEPLTVAGRDVDPRLWLAVLFPILLLVFVYIAWMYRRDARSIRWYWAAGLGLARAAVYVLVAYVFLLPARQVWEVTERQSRVALVLDVSASVTEESDDRKTPETPTGQTPTRRPRVQKVIDLLTDEQVGLVRRLLEKNPVAVYRMGGRAEDEPTMLAAAGKPLAAADWAGFVRFDFKPWLMEGLSDGGKASLRGASAWRGDDPGEPAWAVEWLREAPPRDLPEADAELLRKKRVSLNGRVEVARQVQEGTNVPASVLTVLNREANNMLQGVIVISDGRSNRGSEATLTELVERAKRDGVPVFTVAVGEDRPKVQIRITDVQAPDVTPPDEAFKVYAEVDGVGLADREVPVTLEVIPPGSEEPAERLVGQIKFAPGEPPHGQAEFVIDPAKMPQALRSRESQFKDLVEGEWRFRARVPRDAREDFAEPEHVSDKPAKVQVLKSPLRVLLVASAPTKDFQFIRTLLVRENERAETSIYLQNEAGRVPDLALDVDRNRTLTRFPDRIDVSPDAKEDPEGKFYNLARYDVVVAFDPNWALFSADQLKLLERWVDGGGGFVFVAGPICTAQLAQTDDRERLRPLRDILPVEPGDNVLAGARRSTRDPWRLSFPGVSPDTDFLRIDESVEGPLAGWQTFFTGSENVSNTVGQKPVRGFYNFYPVAAVKKGAAVIARFTDPEARGDAGQEPPFLATLQVRQGRSVFLGSAETWRIRSFDRAYFERFWLKLMRYASAGSRRKQSRRGRLLMGDEFAARAVIRLQAQLTDAQMQPLADTATPKLTIIRTDIEKDRAVPKIFQMSARRGPEPWAGVFQRQVVADAREFPPGEYRLELEIPDSSETLNKSFRVKATDPERDDTRPDYAALAALSSDFETVSSRIEDPALLKAIREELRQGERAPLAFKLAETAKLARVPDCMRAETRVNRTRGPVEDLWDKGPTLPASWTAGFTDKPVMVSTLLLVIVGLLSAEWLTRKLLRLA